MPSKIFALSGLVNYPKQMQSQYITLENAEPKKDLFPFNFY